MPGASPAVRRAALGVTLALAFAACGDFVTVDTPDVVGEGDIDPVEDGPLLSHSAFQDFVQGWGAFLLFGAWFTTEAWAGDSADDINQFGRRAVDPTNPRLNQVLWPAIARGLATSETVVDALSGQAGSASDVDLARVLLSAGYGYVEMAEMFCRGTARGGPELDTAEMLARAVNRLERAVAVGSASPEAEGRTLAAAARVGLARAHLQAGEPSAAAASASQVSPGFEMWLVTVDDPSYRERLGNRLFEATDDRPGLVVPPAYRAMYDAGDARVPYLDYGVLAYDGYLDMVAQAKYRGWAAPYRLASGLEALYIAVEAAGDPEAMRAFVNERRAVAGMPPLGAVGGGGLLDALLEQRSRDFWLEGQRMGDLRRHPGRVPHVIPPGTSYYKPGSGPVRGDRCLPLPIAETDNNPHLPVGGHDG